MEDLMQAVALAEHAAHIAGDYLLAHQDQTHIIAQKAPDDPLLDADLEAQRLILQTLQSSFPSLGFCRKSPRTSVTAPAIIGSLTLLMEARTTSTRAHSLP